MTHSQLRLYDQVVKTQEQVAAHQLSWIDSLNPKSQTHRVLRYKRHTQTTSDIRL